jgi:2,4-didehydro-3-deoxy-L-rhamnonate hydrolase
MKAENNMTFRLANVSGRAALCTETHHFDLERVSGGTFSSDPMVAISRFAELHQFDLSGHSPDGLLDEADLGAPIPSPRNCFAIGLNYLDHAAESKMELPAAPLTFTKFPSCIVGPRADVVLNSAHGDYEVELVVVVGSGGRNISESDAWKHIAGLTVGQDISDRALQFAAKPPHFDLGKSRDTYGPIGPVVVSVDSFANPDKMHLRCSVNGEERQNGTSDQLIFTVPKLIAYLSSILTLQTGDLIFTGTPEGVGAPKGLYLKAGDIIDSHIEGIGSLRNHCLT